MSHLGQKWANARAGTEPLLDGWVVRTTAALCLVTALTGCQTEIYGRVSEKEANEMMSVLLMSGINAQKQVVDEKTWRVTVPNGSVGPALEILRLEGLPQENFVSIGDVFKKEGLVSTPSEERIRYIYAVSQELGRTLTEIDGVLNARVHVVIPANDPLSSVIKPASASIFIKHRADSDLAMIAPAVKNLVMRSIEGLSYENISLSFFPARRAYSPPQSANSGYSGTLLTTILGLMVVSLAIILVGFLYRFREFVGFDISATFRKVGQWWAGRRADKASAPPS